MSAQLPPAPPPADDRAVNGSWAASSGSDRSKHRRGLMLLAIAAVLAALVGGGAVGESVGVRRADQRWKPLYDRSVADGARFEADSQSWQDNSDRYEKELQTLQKKVKTSVGDLDHPQFTVWNVPQTLDGAHYLFGSVPDTFRWTLDIRSTRAPIKVLIMTDQDYACWYSNGCYAHWRYWGPSDRIYASWDAARGCAGYVFVITSSGPTTVIPKETITRDPAVDVTGACQA